MHVDSIMGDRKNIKDNVELYHSIIHKTNQYNGR